VDQHKIDAITHDTSEPLPGLRESNEQWAARVRGEQDARASEQLRRDDSARHAAIMTTAECLVRIKHLLGLILLCTLLILLCTLLILWKG
jgi:hypothetical protein